MTKRELIEEVASRYALRFSRQDAEVLVNVVFDSLTAALAREERIELRGFGSFSLKHRQAGDRRNPRTGASVTVPARKVPFFKVAKDLHLRVNGKGMPREGRGEKQEK